jgi:hypothetical protein
MVPLLWRTWLAAAANTKAGPSGACVVPMAAGIATANTARRARVVPMAATTTNTACRARVVPMVAGNAATNTALRARVVATGDHSTS